MPALSQKVAPAKHQHDTILHRPMRWHLCYLSPSALSSLCSELCSGSPPFSARTNATEQRAGGFSERAEGREIQLAQCTNSEQRERCSPPLRTNDMPQVGAAVVRKHLLRACVLITCKPEKRRQGSAWRHNRGEGELCVHVPLPSRSKANSLPCAVVFRLDMIHACTAEERPSARSCCSTSPLLLHGLRARRPSAARPAQRAQRELTF
jgi:hypothetical protein